MFSDIKVVCSSDEHVQKYVFTAEDAVAEAVLYKYPTYEERTVICCSTMSGCPIGCRFCGSGDNFVRSLTRDEIVKQPVELLNRTGVDPLKIKKLQIMFMSMGEPMLNQKALIEAMELLHSFFPNAALLVSTSAPAVDYTPFLNAAYDIPTIGLQFSVHESTDEARNKLIPFKKKLTLREIAEVGEKFFSVTGRKPFFNYCAHEGNTSREDAMRLHDLFDPMIFNATISVICERDESVAAANARQEKLAAGFAGLLVGHGYNTRVFNPAGQDDIGGGCGQLWFVQEWMREHPDLARPSAGRGLIKIHTPQ